MTTGPNSANRFLKLQKKLTAAGLIGAMACLASRFVWAHRHGRQIAAQRETKPKPHSNPIHDLLY